jgi:hypothetical protein
MSNTAIKNAIDSIKISSDKDNVFSALTSLGLNSSLPIGKLIQNHRGDFAITKVLLAAKNQIQYLENNVR